MILGWGRNGRGASNCGWLFAAVFVYVATVAVPVRADLQAAIEKIRKEHFKETSHGVPGVSESDVDEAFVESLFKSDAKVADALGKILNSDEYRGLNRKIGEVRNRINVEVWCEIAHEYGIRLELNNAGKMNGVISDLDQTLYTDVEEVVTKSGQKITGSDNIHKHLMREFDKRYRTRMDAGLPIADTYDMMHFAGDGMMSDWRMSKMKSADFLIALDEAIAKHSNTPGAYFIPGAYKTQVYTRYLTEGRTLVIDASIEAQSRTTTIPGYGEITVPDGVDLKYGETKKLSKLYKNVPITQDRTGALGALVENHFHADHVENVVKKGKYGNRIPDTALIALTNLEVDFRHLVLEGRTGARTHFVEKLFRDAKNNLPANIESLDEIQDVFELQQRIELDKVLRNIPKEKRPKTWTAEWRGYEPNDINNVDTKLKYFAKEAEEIKAALAPFEEGGVDMTDPATRQQVAELAEGAFFQKVKTINRLGAAQAAQKVFRQVFTRQGYARMKHIHGPEKARNLLIERVRELHAMMVMTDDPQLIKTVMDNAPAEARPALKNLHDIAMAQREEIKARRGSLKRIEAGELKASNQVLRDLLRRLNMSEFDPNYRAGEARAHAGVKSIRSFAPTDWVDRHVSLLLTEELIDNYKDGQTIKSLSVGKVAADPSGTIKNMALETYAYNADRVRTFFNSTLPAYSKQSFGTKLKGFGRAYVTNILDWGSVDTSVKVAAAYATGDKQAMMLELRDAAITALPYGMGQSYVLYKGLSDAQNGNNTPLMLFISQNALQLIPHYGGPAAAVMGKVMTVYLIYKMYGVVHWKLYGQPSQMGAISYILTGENDAVPIQRDGGNLFMNFDGSPTHGILQRNAILNKHVPVPDLPREYRNAVLDMFFRSTANNAAWDAIGEDDMEDYKQLGEGSAWHVARNKHMSNTYYRHWRYWFQRLWFYHTLHPKVYKEIGKNRPLEIWAGFYPEPPPEVYHLSKAELMDRFGMAWDPGAKVWDYEKIYTAMYFGKWVEEWEAGMDKMDVHARRFFTALEDRGGEKWRQAVVNELMRYYMEGEAFHMANPLNFTRAEPYLDPEQKQTKQEYEQMMRGISKKAVASIAKETHGKGRGRIEQIEGLYWHPEIRKAMEQAILQAAERQPAYQPEKPEVKLKIPNNVARAGKGMRVDVMVKGDTKEMPDDIQFKVDYRPVREHKGSLPADVVKDDILTAFGREMKEEDLMVAEHEATLTAFSPSDSGFKLTSKETVYWLDYNDEEDDANADELGGDEPPGDPEGPGLIDEATSNADAAVAAAREAENACGEARKAADRAQKAANRVSGMLKDAANWLKELDGHLEEAGKAVGELQRLRGTINQSARKIAAIRGPLGKAALRTCQLTQRLKESEDREERERIMKQIGQSFSEAVNLYKDAKDAYQQLRIDLKAAGAMSASVEKANATAAILDRLFAKIGEGLSEFESELINAKNLAALVGEHLDRANKLRDANASLLAKSEGEVKTRLEAELGRVNGALELSKDCSANLAAHTQELEGLLAEMREEHQRLQDAFGKSRERLEKIGQGQIDSLQRDITSMADAADLLWQSVTKLYAQARHCMNIAEDFFKRPLLITVPNLVGMSATEVKSALDKLGLGLSPVGGMQAPAGDLAHKVAQHMPTAGGKVEEGESVRVVFYGKAIVNVPNVVGRAPETAEGILVDAGFRGKFFKGKPAPTPSKSRTVASQKPAAGAELAPGGTVSVVVYAPYMDPSVEVPVVVGYEPEAARGILAKKGLKAKFDYGKPAGTPDKQNMVYAQLPVPGARAAKGSTVSVKVFAAYVPTEATVPSVIGMRERSAQDTLQAKGFQVSIKRDVKEAPKSIYEYQVFGQTPGAGQKAPIGSTVVVSLYGQHTHNGVPERPGKKPEPAPKPKPEPQAEPEAEFFVVFDIYTVNNLSALLGIPKKDRSEQDGNALMRAMQDKDKKFDSRKANALERKALGIDPDRFRFERSDKSKFGMRVSSGGLKKYFIKDFQTGKKYSLPLSLSGSKGSIKGALLIRVAEVFTDAGAFRAKYPNASFRSTYRSMQKKKSKLIPMDMRQSSGRFSFETVEESGSFTFAGGPLKPGWSDEDKRDYIRFMFGFIRMCASEQAFLGHPEEAERVLTTLRRFRDRVLKGAPGGGEVIDFYYTEFSPRAIEAMQRYPATRGVLRKCLTAAANLIETGETVAELSRQPETIALHGKP